MGFEWEFHVTFPGTLMGFQTGSHMGLKKPSTMGIWYQLYHMDAFCWRKWYQKKRGASPKYLRWTWIFIGCQGDNRAYVAWMWTWENSTWNWGTIWLYNDHILPTVWINRISMNIMDTLLKKKYTGSLSVHMSSLQMWGFIENKKYWICQPGEMKGCYPWFRNSVIFS